MTCREFKHKAAVLSLCELSQTGDEQILGHADDCKSCGDWLEKQRTLAGGLSTLQARTAKREAGANVERALLRSFRQEAFELREGGAAPSSAQIVRLSGRLSRFFEAGAYVAVAAAIVVALFLGARLLVNRNDTNAAPVTASKSKAASVQEKNVAASPTPMARSSAAKLSSTAAPSVHQPAKSHNARLQPVEEQPQVNSDADYVALMFCDPLSCSTDAQVVRMELPASASDTTTGAEAQLADVVVGYDGVVRAVRILN
jgi:hypothetical protein